MSKLQLLFFLIFTMFTTSLFADSELEIRSVFERQADRYGTKLLQNDNDTRELLERGANPNVIIDDSGDRTPFMVALSDKKIDDARLII